MSLSTAARLLRNARHATAFTGAAISHLESFIATPDGHQLGDEKASNRLIEQARTLIESMQRQQRVH